MKRMGHNQELKTKYIDTCVVLTNELLWKCLLY